MRKRYEVYWSLPASKYRQVPISHTQVLVAAYSDPRTLQILRSTLRA